MLNSNLISVIIPVYNSKDYLNRCLDSIIGSTYDNLEIICVDDGSKDESVDVIQSYCALDSRVKLIRKENGGVSSARNVGIKEAVGEYISFIDSDDWVNIHYFEYLVKAINTNNADIAVCDDYKTESDIEWDENILFSGRMISISDLLSVHDLKSYVWGKLYRRSVIEGVKFDESAKIEDVLYNFTVCCKNSDLKIVYVECPLYAYYIRGNSLVSQINEDALLQLIESYTLLYQETEFANLKEEIAQEIVKRGLSARYAFILKGNKQEIKKCNVLIAQALNQKFEKNYLYRLLYYFPGMYRLYRISKDKTLLVYEKNIKEQIKGNY